ncbi:MAG: hypothetical protein U9Q70_09825 [Chloroflexota bacterium]|nr:hypothetical protein [Chloroflexota bacterium]
MSELNLVKQSKDQILLAEIAGLLHNLGKLDPNFLRDQTREEEQKNASEAIRDEHQEIVPYHFKRFASPEATLFQPAIRRLIFESTAELTRKEELWEELRNFDVWSEEERQTLELLSAAEWGGKQRNEYPRLNKTLLSVWQLLVWLRGRGSLYLPQVDKREAIHQEQQELRVRRAQLASNIGQAPADQKPQLGRKLGQLSAALEGIEAKEQLLAQAEKAAQDQFEGAFQQWPVAVADEQWSLAHLLTLFWDEFHYKPSLPQQETDSEDKPGLVENQEDPDYKREAVLPRWLENGRTMALPTLLMLAHGEISGGEKFWAPEEEVDIEKQPWPPDYFATAFGYDRGKLKPWELQAKRFELLAGALEACADPSGRRGDFVDKAKKILRLGLGDTQWPINEIDLWDYASAIAALFKSGVARAVLDGAIPAVEQMRWRFLSVRFDGLGYLSQAHHVTDLLGRQDSLEMALNAVQTLLEETCPLGNEVYRDENGVVFIVPGWEDDSSSTLALANESGVTLEDLIAQTFRDAAREKTKQQQSLPSFAGELVPVIQEGASVRGKALQLGEYLQKQDQALAFTAEPTRMAAWWAAKQAEQRELCTVCGVRPVGYRPKGMNFPHWVKTEYARERHICCVCLHRRRRRVEKWLQHKDAQWLQPKEEYTIWTDEVADQNGRLALLVGQFQLERWLDGTLIPSMQKPASFARVQRSWETTQKFWQEVQAELIPNQLAASPRLVITPRNRKDLRKKLQAHNVYELQVSGGTLSVLWEPQGGELFLIENLAALSRRLELDQNQPPFEAVQAWLQQHAAENDNWRIWEPSGYNEPAQAVECPVVFKNALGADQEYCPQIPLLAAPQRFMTLLPATQAMKIVTAIQQKYEREFSKVQDRLPLHLSLVVAPRRTPLRAILEAGRAMLARPAQWTEWTVQKVTENGTRPVHLSSDAHFSHWRQITLQQEETNQQLTLRVADRMGDGETRDRWHAHFCTQDPSKPATYTAPPPWQELEPVAKLAPGTQVYLNPATFDFEYLDTTARRFTIAYDEDGRRLGHTRASRPYLLNEIEWLAQLWEWLNEYLETTQWMWIHGLIEEKRREWQQPRGPQHAYSDVFEQFITATLHNAEWKEQPKTVSEQDKFDQVFKALRAAARDGVWADLIDLYHEALKLRPL